MLPVHETEVIPPRHFARYLCCSGSRYPREEIGELLRRRDTNTEEVEDGTPAYRAMLPLVWGVRQDVQRQGAQKRRALA